MDCSLPGSSVHGIFQARVLEWVAIAFSSNFLYKNNQTVNILDFASHTISVTTVELRCGNTKTAKDSNPYVNGAIVFQ